MCMDPATEWQYIKRYKEKNFFSMFTQDWRWDLARTVTREHFKQKNRDQGETVGSVTVTRAELE